MSSPGSMVATTTTLLTRSRTQDADGEREQQPGARPGRAGRRPGSPRARLGQDALLDSGGSTHADEDRPRTPTIAAAAPRAGQSSVEVRRRGLRVVDPVPFGHRRHRRHQVLGHLGQHPREVVAGGGRRPDVHARPPRTGTSGARGSRGRSPPGPGGCAGARGIARDDRLVDLGEPPARRDRLRARAAARTARASRGTRRCRRAAAAPGSPARPARCGRTAPGGGGPARRRASSA